MKKKQWNVMVVDDHAIFRQGLILSLKTITDLKIVGEAENGRIFLSLLPVLNPDIVFLDIKMPEVDGIQAAEKSLQMYPDLKIIVMTMFDETAYFNRMVELGVSGFLLKTSDQLEIERAVQRVKDDDTYFSPSLLNKSHASELSQTLNEELTNREIEVLKEICKGLSNHEIADNLFISRRTVDGHRANILDKTGSKNTVGLVLYAIKHNLIKIE